MTGFELGPVESKATTQPMELKQMQLSLSLTFENVYSLSTQCLN